MLSLIETLLVRARNLQRESDDMLREAMTGKDGRPEATAPGRATQPGERGDSEGEESECDGGAGHARTGGGGGDDDARENPRCPGGECGEGGEGSGRKEILARVEENEACGQDASVGTLVVIAGGEAEEKERLLTRELSLVDCSRWEFALRVGPYAASVPTCASWNDDRASEPSSSLLLRIVDALVECHPPQPHPQAEGSVCPQGEAAASQNRAALIIVDCPEGGVDERTAEGILRAVRRGLDIYLMMPEGDAAGCRVLPYADRVLAITSGCANTHLEGDELWWTSILASILQGRSDVMCSHSDMEGSHDKVVIDMRMAKRGKREGKAID